MTLPVLEVRQILIAAGLPIGFWELPDTSFETVSAEWVHENWQWWLESRPDKLVLWQDVGGKKVRWRPLYQPESFDCENLALATVAHAQVGNALKTVNTGLPRGGLLYGFLLCRLDSHSINWFVDHDKQVGFFEPQTGDIISYSAQHRTMSWFGFAS